MKTTTTFLAALTVGSILLLGLSFSSGPASSGGAFRTGAPSAGGGTESTCSGCHNSGASTFGEPAVSWTIAETDGGTNVMSYNPGQTYFVTVAVSAPTGTPAGYGFQAVFLNDPIAGIPTGSGTASATDENSQIFSDGNGRQYVEHNKRTPSGTWKFQWTAPAAGAGDVKLYSVGNSVNGAGGRTGDSGSTFSTVITLMEETLPVELTTFTATAAKREVRLNWSSSSEQNVSHYELERSADGVTFLPIAELPANGNSSRSLQYDYTDDTAPSGLNYYRLRMVDMDATFAYSPVVKATVSRIGTPRLALFPNPARTIVNLRDALAGDGNIRVLTPTGQEVWQGPLQPELNVSALLPGVYLVEVTNGEERQVSRLVKQ